MSIEIYVGNLNYDTNEDAIQTLFAEFGTVENVSIIQDRYTGRSRGFGFVTMSTEEEGNAAIEGINGKELEGRALTCNHARGKQDRPPRRGGGGRRDRGDRGDRHQD